MTTNSKRINHYGSCMNFKAKNKFQDQSIPITLNDVNDPVYSVVKLNSCQVDKNTPESLSLSNNMTIITDKKCPNLKKSQVISFKDRISSISSHLDTIKSTITSIKQIQNTNRINANGQTLFSAHNSKNKRAISNSICSTLNGPDHSINSNTSIFSTPVKSFQVGRLCCKFVQSINFYDNCFEYLFYHPYNTSTEILLVMYYKVRQ